MKAWLAIWAWIRESNMAEPIAGDIKLTMKHHFDVSELLRSLPRSELIRLGGALGLYYPKLNKMADDLVSEMVAAWLNGEDGVLERSGEPSWMCLADALKKIEQNGIAEIVLGKIEVTAVPCGDPTPIRPSNNAARPAVKTASINVLDSKPVYHQLDLIEGNGKKVRVISAMASKWDTMALRLYFDGTDIERIRMDSHHQCESACRKMFQEWLDGNGRKPLTWRTLVKAVHEAGMSECAKDMKDALNAA